MTKTNDAYKSGPSRPEACLTDDASGVEDKNICLKSPPSIVSTILPITSAEPALFGVYAVDLLSRWRALRGFRKTLEDDHD